MQIPPVILWLTTVWPRLQLNIAGTSLTAASVSHVNMEGNALVAMLKSNLNPSAALVAIVSTGESANVKVAALTESKYLRFENIQSGTALINSN
jgi:hypothetical protein